MSSLSVTEIFGRNYFKTYSEFYLALAIGNVLGNKGYTLSMDGMTVDADAIPHDMIVYYKKLLSDGVLSLSMFTGSSSVVDTPKTYVDTSYFDKIDLTNVVDGKLRWSLDFAKTNYGEYSGKFLEFLNLGNTLMHLVANHIVNNILNGEKRKLVIEFDYQKAKTTFLYVNIYSVLQTIPWLKDLVELDIDFDDYVVDLDYSIFCSNGRVAGRYKLHTVTDKLNIMKKYGMTEGAILVLWERDGMCENNEYGHITGARLFRLDEVGDSFISVTTIAVNKTKEEVKEDYYDIDESIRYLFVDMLDKAPNTQSFELDLFGLGIDNYFFDEDKYITLLDESEEVYKTVTIDDEVVRMQMSGVDAIYWLLCQYGVEFDRDLYKSMYFTVGQEPLWDKYNE